MPSQYDVFDHRIPFLVGDVCDGGIKSVERAYFADASGILIVSATKPFVSFMEMCQIMFLCNIDILTFPHELIGSGCAVLPRKRALIVPIEENGLYAFINLVILRNMKRNIQP